MIVPLFCLSLWCLAVSGHEYYSGRCPQFVPMASLDWQSFTGDWWVVFKMSSRSSCIRYNFATSGGERIVTEEKLLPVLGRWVKRRPQRFLKKIDILRYCFTENMRQMTHVKS